MQKLKFTKDHPLVVCLGFPPFADERFLARLREVPFVEPVVLPIDPDASWADVAAHVAYPEPPPWATSVAAEREAALARSHVLITLHTPDQLDRRAPNLAWIQGSGAGVEQFAEAGIDPHKVVLTNSAGVAATSMSEWVIGRLLQVFKRFRAADEFQQAHLFKRSYGRTFSGSTIGIVGLGHIGRAVAVRARAMGCRTLGLRRSARSGEQSPYVDQLFAADELHTMLGGCDTVVIAAPATPETHHLMDAKALAALPRHAVLVNVARGSLLDESELARVMLEEPLAAAILDVFEPEPLDPASPLWDIPNVYISAHSSVSLDHYVDDVFDLFLDNVQRFVSGEELQNRVDMKMLGFKSI
ncbi:MAG TPA: D-2-hydroxyacid dehydrogenase [Myxococcales bacterium]|nr:D-2-hydroxyacid dehydrogenase [Myxococcales bacterium]